jgi:uncharacterized protein YndB with AHSA1/START domain
MGLIMTSVEIARPPGEVFAYATDPSRFGEWQAGVVSGHIEGDGVPAVGDRCVMTRRLGGAKRTVTSQITAMDPPATWAIRGLDGPIRAEVKVSVEPRREGQQSHLTISLDFSGHGVGKMLLPLVVRQARTEVPQSCQRLKQRLEQPQSG